MSSTGLGDLQGLPPEIRDTIYGLLLRSPSAIKIARRQVRPSSGKASYKLSATTLAAAKDTEKGTTRRRTVPTSSILEVSVLRVSKALNAETAPMLYYRNSFVFTHSKALNDLILRAPEMASLLSKAEVKAVAGRESWKFLQDTARYVAPETFRPSYVRHRVVCTDQGRLAVADELELVQIDR